MTTNLFGHERERGGGTRPRRRKTSRERWRAIAREKRIAPPFRPNESIENSFREDFVPSPFLSPSPYSFPRELLTYNSPFSLQISTLSFFSGLRYSVRFKWRIIGGFLAPRLSLRLRPKRSNCNTVYPPCGCCTPRSSIMASRYYSSREYARGRGILIDGFRVESESQVRI